MPSSLLRRTLRIWIAVLLACALAVVMNDHRRALFADLSRSALGLAPTTTLPPVFPPPTTDGTVRAVRTPAGFVLPVTGPQASDGTWPVLTPCAQAASVPGEPVVGANIVLDPGHGGSEPGAVGPSGLTERDVNLDVARRVKARLEADGAVVVLTRDRDVRMTLQTRAAIATALQPLAFVSIHHNAASVGVAAQPGSEVYPQADSPEARRLAGLVWQQLQIRLAPFATEWATGDDPGVRSRRSAATGEDFYGILRRAAGVPSVLTEAAFLSAPIEDALLNTPEFRQAEADALADAIVAWQTTADPGAGFVADVTSSTSGGSGGGAAGCEDPSL